MRFNRPLEEMEFILATDVGSTTTKARFFKKIKGEWRYVTSGEAPSTVEAPYEDVTMGVRNAVREVEELTGHTILSEGGTGIICPRQGENGVDLYCTTSSAGGGLQMMVAGVIKTITAESANRAALGAGAIVMDVFAADDGRADFQKIRSIRSLRPDMILQAGGTDGGTVDRVVKTAELISASDPKPRLGVSYQLPIVFAGNKDVIPHIKKLMGDNFALSIVDNIRPVLEVENIEPSREAIHELFMEHVMAHAPGYNKLMKWTDIDIMPTPAGEGMAIRFIANTYKTNVMGVGLGGATTNIYSIVDEKFARSVSANLGMSYSICNVLKEAGLNNIMRWIPLDVDAADVRNRLRNKMIRPTTIPQTLEELMIEHAVAREALRLGLNHHKSIATRLKGARVGGTMAEKLDMARLREWKETYIEMMKIKIVAGTGGLLSHAPRRIQSLIVLSDGFQTEGVTRMFQDSVFMMPHLGVLSTVHPDAAWSVFDKDCLVRLGTVIAPAGRAKEGEKAVDLTLDMPDGSTVNEELKFGEIKRIQLPERQQAKGRINPHGNLDVGAGPGKSLETTIVGGVEGIVVDARGRPIIIPKDDKERKEKLTEWFTALKLYPSFEGK